MRRNLRRLDRFRARPAPVRKSFYFTYMLEPVMRVLVRAVGYRGAYRFATMLADRLRKDRPSCPVEMIEEGFALAVRNHPWRGDCLSRSLTLFSLLRARGHMAQLKVGVRRDQAILDAHAWVELDGKRLSYDGILGGKFRLLGTLAS